MRCIVIVILISIVHVYTEFLLFFLLSHAREDDEWLIVMCLLLTH